MNQEKTATVDPAAINLEVIRARRQPPRWMEKVQPLKDINALIAAVEALRERVRDLERRVNN